MIFQVIFDFSQEFTKAPARPLVSSTLSTAARRVRSWAYALKPSRQVRDFSLLFRPDRGEPRVQGRFSSLRPYVNAVSIPLLTEAGFPWYVDCNVIQFAADSDAAERVAPSVSANGEEGI